MRIVNRVMLVTTLCLTAVLIFFVSLAVFALTVDYPPVDPAKVTQYHTELCQSVHDGADVITCINSTN